MQTAKLEHHVWEPSRTVDLVMAMKQNSLISVRKFTDAEYLTVFNNEKVIIYDGVRTNCPIKEEAILREWWDPSSELYRIPLKVQVDNLKTDMVLLGKERSDEINAKRPVTMDAINNMYELPSTLSSVWKLK